MESTNPKGKTCLGYKRLLPQCGAYASAPSAFPLKGGQGGKGSPGSSQVRWALLALVTDEKHALPEPSSAQGLVLHLWGEEEEPTPLTNHLQQVPRATESGSQKD